MDIKKLTISLITVCSLVASLISPIGSDPSRFTSDQSLTVEAAETNSFLSGKPTSCALIADSSKGDVALECEKKYFSPNSKYYVIYQIDGNLVVYENSTKKAVWNSCTATNTMKRCVLQVDGNLVIYDKNNNPAWHSHTNEKRNASLYLSDNGELCIYSEKEGMYTFSSSGSPSTLTFHTLIANSSDGDKELVVEKSYYSQNRKYRAVYQIDGNLVVYDNNKNAVWNSCTATNTMKRCVMQKDGNLVIYGKDNKAAWHSKTNEMRNASLYLSDAGELCIYSEDKGAYTFLSHAIAISANKTITLDVDRKYYSPNANYYAKFQSDGNLVVYNKKGNWVWQSGTKNSGKTCKMQVDGNLVIYDAKNNPVWRTYTNEMRNAVLYLTDTGKLCIYSNDKKKCTFVSDYKISIPDSELTIVKHAVGKIDTSITPVTNGNKYVTGFTKLGQTDGLMLRRVDVNTTITFSSNITEADIRKNFCFYVRYKFQDPATQEIKEGSERGMRTEPEYFEIEQLGNREYKLTCKNIPCLGDEVDFRLVNNSGIKINQISKFKIKNSDKDAQIYDVLCKNGENIHISMKFNCSENNIQIWIKALCRYVNSLSNLTGVKKNNIYILEFADQLCICPNADNSIIPASTSVPAVLVPTILCSTVLWNNTYQDVETSIKDSPNSIHLLYLHELSHCYATNKFNNTFNCNIDDGNTNVRGITAMQNCIELNNTVLYANQVLGTYQTAIRNLADSKYEENVNFKIMNMFASYIEAFGNKNGWSILERYFEGGDQFFNANLYSSDVIKNVKDELKKSTNADKNNCNNLCEESLRFINSMQFLQQNAPETLDMTTFVNNIVNKNSEKREYTNTLLEYMERVEKMNRGIAWDTGRYLSTKPGLGG